MPPVVAFLNFMRSGTLRRFVPQGWNLNSRGFLHKLLILLEGSGKLLWARRGTRSAPFRLLISLKRRGNAARQKPMLAYLKVYFCLTLRTLINFFFKVQTDPFYLVFFGNFFSLYISKILLLASAHFCVYSCTCYCLKVVGEWGGGRGGGWIESSYRGYLHTQTGGMDTLEYRPCISCVSRMIAVAWAQMQYAWSWRSLQLSS